MTSGRGWPKVLRLPTEMTASCGATRARNSGVVEVRLPWWPTLSSVAGIVVVGRGCEDCEVDRIPTEAVAGAEVAHVDAERGGLVEQGAIGYGVGIDGDPKFAGTEVAQDGGHSSHVVGVGVGEGYDVEAAEVARPEVGGDDLFSDVECGIFRAKTFGVLGVGGGPGGATGVDEHGAASGADNEERIALAYIDGGDFELVGMDGGRHGPENDCSGKSENGDGCPCGRARPADGPAAEGEAGDGEQSVRQHGAGDADVGGRHTADAVDGAGDAVQQERQRGAG